MAPSRAMSHHAKGLFAARLAPQPTLRVLHQTIRIATAVSRPHSRAAEPAPKYPITFHAHVRHTSTTTSSGPGASTPEPPDYLSEGELKIFNILKAELAPSKLEVQDISGGCGSMYGLDIVSAKFAGLPVIKQHRLVNKVLGEEIKKWHGVQLKTKAP